MTSSRPFSYTNCFLGDSREDSTTFRTFTSPENIAEVKKDVSARINEIYGVNYNFTDNEVLAMMQSVFSRLYVPNIELLTARTKYYLYSWAKSGIDKRAIQMHDIMHRRRLAHGTTSQLYSTIGTPYETTPLRKVIRRSGYKFHTALL